LKTGTERPDCPPEDIGDLQEHLKTGVELLLFVVGGVVAVFANEQDAVDGELGATEGQRFGDGAGRWGH
jgi:hypothetical protein